MADDRFAIPGTLKPTPTGATNARPCDGTATASVSLSLRRRAALALAPGQQVSREEFAARFGAAPDDVKAVQDFAARFGLTVAECDIGRRTVVLSGSLDQLGKAFGVTFACLDLDGAAVRMNREQVSLPASLRGVVEAVLGLDTLPAART